MTSFSSFDFSKLPLCESIIITLKAVRKDFPTDHVLKELNNYVEEARLFISIEEKPYSKLKMLLQLFYKDWNFRSASGIYKLSDVLWLDRVLKTRQGTAVSLGVILLHIAQHLNLPLVPVIFPTQLILRADEYNEKMWLINPCNGETLNKHILKVWLKGNISPTAKLYKNDLNRAKSLTVIRKILDTLKIALMEEKKMELALNVSNVLLTLDPKDPYEIRDRGLIYAQLDCIHVALLDLIYFVEQCPEDPISEIIKVQIHSMRQKKLILH